MKVSMFRFYKTSIIVGLVYGSIVLIGSIIISVYYATGKILEDCIFPICGITLALLGGLSPILIVHRQLTHVYLDHERCTSYSLLRQKLCQVNYNEYVFYSFFDVGFTYSPPIRFIAISNMPFECEQNPKSIFAKKFYGYYDRSKIIIMPYDDEVASFLKLDDWHENI